MKYRLNLCEKHYGTAVVDTKSKETAVEMAQDVIERGGIFWTKTELCEVSAEPEPFLHRMQCLNCGHNFVLKSASRGQLGWHTSCPQCNGTFDIDLPNDCDELQDLFGYCRVDSTVILKYGIIVILHRLVRINTIRQMAVMTARSEAATSILPPTILR